MSAQSKKEVCHEAKQKDDDLEVVFGVDEFQKLTPIQRVIHLILEHIHLQGFTRNGNYLHRKNGERMCTINQFVSDFIQSRSTGLLKDDPTLTTKVNEYVTYSNDDIPSLINDASHLPS
jgi:hypothetical protein